MFDQLPYPAADYHVCPCCGTEFGNDDAEYSHDQLREMWLAGGAHWFFGAPPANWNWYVQLYAAGMIPVLFTGIGASTTETDVPRLDLAALRAVANVEHAARVQ